MLGAIVGDVIGSIYECRCIRTKDFELFRHDSCFTDDTVLTVAIADALLQGTDYVSSLKQYCRRYPHAGYGKSFYNWSFSESLEPYNSFGNGSAMRVSPIAYAFPDLATVLKEAQRSAEVTHNHPEGIKGAQAIAAAVWMARQGSSQAEIKTYAEGTFGYNLNWSLETVPPSDVSCQNSVPQALVAFLESSSFEDAIRNAIFIGGDTDTIACMAGAIAEAFYGGVPPAIADTALNRLDGDLRSVTQKFQERYPQ